MRLRRQELALSVLVAAGLALITTGVGLAWAPGWWVMAGVSVIVLAVLLLVEV